MKYTVKQLAALSGVTPRTLRWYDLEGLLKPLRRTDAGYRLYGPQEVDRLQQILFYRELGLELSAIRRLLDDPAFDREAALQSHLAALEARRTRLDALILTVKKTLKGASMMSDLEKFECFKQKVIRENEETYGAEVRARYGNEVMDRAAYTGAVLGYGHAGGGDPDRTGGRGPVRGRSGRGRGAGPGHAAQSLAFPLLGGALVQPGSTPDAGRHVYRGRAVHRLL